MHAEETPSLDARIAALEAELQRLKGERARQQGKRPKPLDGIRIMDLSRFIFGPFCTQMLADMGAEIIKVEPRDTGDPARQAGNTFVNGESASFFARNRNKRSLAVDLRQPAGQEIARRLAERCDVLVHNFRPGVMARLGLDAKRLHDLNPRLIYCSLSGYGQTGPYADWPGQDILLQAMGGIISTTGWPDGRPTAVGTYLADVTGALTAAYGIVTALHARAQQGVGQEMDVSLLDAMIALQSMEATVYLNSGNVPWRSGSGHWMLPQPYGVFKTQDKDMALNAHSEAWWARLCRVPEFAHLATDERYRERQTRAQHHHDLAADLQAILLTKTRDAWLSYLGEYDVLRAPVYDYADLFADPQVRHNDMVVEQQHPTAGAIKVIGIPVKFHDTPGETGSAAPRLGEHTRDLLQWLGYDAVAIQRLHQDAIIGVLAD